MPPEPAEPPANPPARRMTPALFVATGFGVGLVSPAPGTVGALWGLPWAWVLVAGYGGWWAWLSVPIGILLGVPLCGQGARELGEKDPGPVVWDEIATVPLVFLPVPLLAAWQGAADAGASTAAGQAWLLAIGFGLHRLFDISKPPPCRRLERLPGGWGVMIDDVAAAIYGALVLGAGLWLFG